MNKLAIDTSTQTMGVALMKDCKIVAEYTSESYQDHASRLMPAIDQVMQQAKMPAKALDEIIVTNGPGSYTGTRIGVTTAKTMAWALQVPVKTVSSLKLIAYNGAPFTGYICPFIDARRERVYTGLYRLHQTRLTLVKEEANILFTDWLQNLPNTEEPIVFLSEDMTAFKGMIEAWFPGAVIPAPSIQRMRPSHLFTLADETTASPVHEIVPNYLRLTEAETKWLEHQRSSTDKEIQP